MNEQDAAYLHKGILFNKGMEFGTVLENPVPKARNQFKEVERKPGVNIFLGMESHCPMGRVSVHVMEEMEEAGGGDGCTKT